MLNCFYRISEPIYIHLLHPKIQDEPHITFAADARVYLRVHVMLDGFLARRLKARAKLHPFADAFADFVVVMVCFTAFVLKGFHPFWLLLILIGMFVQFVLSSSGKRPRYDPLGKYYGVFLFAAIAVTLVFPVSFVATTVLISIVLFTVAVLISRFFM